jgi:membrane protein DedA with SNARE-associated domain
VEFLTHYLEEFSYVGIAVWLMLAGLGVPLPEDIPLIFGGAMAGAARSTSTSTSSSAWRSF